MMYLEQGSEATVVIFGHAESGPKLLVLTASLVQAKAPMHSIAAEPFLSSLPATRTLCMSVSQETFGNSLSHKRPLATRRYCKSK